MSPRNNNNSYRNTPAVKNEETPLIGEGGGGDDGTATYYYDEYGRKRRLRRRNKCCRYVWCCLGILLLVGATGGAIGVVFVSQIRESKRVVHKKSNGEYYVTYDSEVNSQNATFAQLAKRMLPPWYLATQRVVNTVFVSKRMRPSNVANARKVLLVTRSLLDAFSPVFAKGSLWKHIRQQCDDGYDLVGKFQDLDHSGVDYSKDLLKERKDDVLDWKKDFLDFNQENNVTKFLLEEEDPELCIRHKSSHLFWGEIEVLPCGHDLAAASLQNLGKVQLTNAAEYWETVQLYDSVVKASREEEFHNLRKELRIFLDEYDLFGEILLPPPTNNDPGFDLQDKLDTLFTAQTKLGDINDHWTAYNIYDTRGTHPEEEEELKSQIDDLWLDFCSWAKENDLTGVIQSVLGLLNAT